MFITNFFRCWYCRNYLNMRFLILSFDSSMFVMLVQVCSFYVQIPCCQRFVKLLNAFLVFVSLWSQFIVPGFFPPILHCYGSSVALSLCPCLFSSVPFSAVFIPSSEGTMFHKYSFYTSWWSLILVMVVLVLSSRIIGTCILSCTLC